MLAPRLWLASVARAPPSITCSGFEISSEEASISEDVIITSSISWLRAVQDIDTMAAARGNLPVTRFFIIDSFKK